MHETNSNNAAGEQAAKLDVQAIERQLSELWKQTAGDAPKLEGEEDDGAVLRARVLNLIVFTEDAEAVPGFDELLLDVAVMHPCRALLLVADPSGEDKDIETRVSSRCRALGERRLCCEQVTLSAAGRFVAELPSAALPLVIADLPTFLFWSAEPAFEDDVFQSLAGSSDRVIIDSARYQKPAAGLRQLARFVGKKPREVAGLSDLNWARLTTWRALLANLYDAPEQAARLETLSRVVIEYVAPPGEAKAVSPKALLFAGWLATRLGWRARSALKHEAGAEQLSLEHDGRAIGLEFRAVSHGAVAPGGIARVELVTESEPRATFVAMRAEDCRNLELHQHTGGAGVVTHVLAGADRPEAELLAAEMEILCHDKVYEAALARAVELLGTGRPG